MQNSSLITRLSLLTSICFILFFYSCNNEKNNAENTIEQPKNAGEMQLEELAAQIEKNPNNAALYHQRAQILMKLGDAQNSILDLKKATDLDSTKPIYFQTTAQFFFENNNLERAIVALNKAASLDSLNPTYYTEAGKYCLYLTNYPTGLLYLEKALALDKNAADAYFYKGYIYQEMGDTSKAIENFNLAAEKNPTIDYPLVQAGLLYAQQGNEAAIPLFDKAYKLNPKNVGTLYNKGFFYQKKKNYALALQEYKNLVTINPQYYQAFYNTGYIYNQLDSVDKAIANFKLATQTNPTYAKAFYMLGVCYEKKKETKKAIENYNMCLTFEPDFLDAQKAVKRLQTKK